MTIFCKVLALWMDVWEILMMASLQLKWRTILQIANQNFILSSRNNQINSLDFGLVVVLGRVLVVLLFLSLFLLLIIVSHSHWPPHSTLRQDDCLQSCVAHHCLVVRWNGLEGLRGALDWDQTHLPLRPERASELVGSVHSRPRPCWTHGPPPINMDKYIFREGGKKRGPFSRPWLLRPRTPPLPP